MIRVEMFDVEGAGSCDQDRIACDWQSLNLQRAGKVHPILYISKLIQSHLNIQNYSFNSQNSTTLQTYKREKEKLKT